jgi:two-component system response regulator HydG
MVKKGTVLVVDDHLNMLKMISDLLRDSFEVLTAATGREGLEKFREDPSDIVVSDIRMPDISGMEVLEEIKKVRPDTEVILMTAYGDVAQAVQAVKGGAYDYVIKPFEPERIVLTLQKALERKRLLERTRHLQEEVQEKFGFSSIIGRSEAMQRAIDLASKAAASDTTVLLTGDSGTGKELFARAIHYCSVRAANRFVAINCAAMPRELIETELFGHVRGAFSGATRDKPGLFEQADGGTMLLDEITELAPELQAKINRALQEKEVRRVGDTKDTAVDVRIIASTNRNLQQALAQGFFREDLYFRLNVFPIPLPPLRERKDDVPLLVRHFMKEIAGQDAERYVIEPAALQKLLNYSWPGNVRELRNAIERAVTLCDGERITADLFALPAAGGTESSIPSGAALAELPYRLAMEQMTTDCQREYVLAVLKRFGGNVTKAAAHAGIERESFHRLMRKCEIRSEEIKRSPVEP